MKNVGMIAAALFLLAVFTILFVACDFNINTPEISSEVVRIHIRANSNSEQDQSVKLCVRDKITAFLTELLPCCKNKDDALSTIQSNTDKLAEIADCELKAQGFDYSTVVLVKTDYFPERTYDGYVFPEGYYDALLILLGEGCGDNWWCVAFPPLCFVPDGDGEQIRYKSWVKEMLDKLFA